MAAQRVVDRIARRGTGVAVFVVASIALIAASANALVLDYEDPETGVEVIRLTIDGADGCTNYMGNQSGESIAWSPDSTRIVFAKWCESDESRTGVYVYDIATASATCIAVADKHWANPIFDHDGDTVWFIDGSDSGRDENGKAPYVVRSVPVPGELNNAGTCPDAAVTRVDIQQVSGNKADDVLVMTKNAPSDADSPLEELFATHVRSGSQWRTIIFHSGGELIDGWGFDNSTNPAHGDYNDGDASIWSPVDSRQIFTNRGTSGNDDTARRGVFTVDAAAQLLYEPFPFNESCSGSYQTPDTVAHSDWAWHAGTGTNIFMSSDRCVWTIDQAGTTATGPWKVFGYLHVNFNRSSTGGALGDIEFVVDEYFDGSGAEPFLYRGTLADLGVGGEGLGNWESVRAQRKLVGHRNRMDTGLNDALKAFEPHPQFSPNGRWVLWQSSSLNEVLGFECPELDCGPPGAGDDIDTSFLDLYLAEVVPSQASGDVTCDGTVDSGDVSALLEYLVGRRVAASGCPLADPTGSVDLSGADVSEDGRIDIQDALVLAVCQRDRDCP